MVQPPWKIVEQFLRKLNLFLPHSPAIMLLGNYLKILKIFVHTKTFTQMFQFSSVAQLYLTFCGPMDCSTPGFPVHHQLSDLAQIHVHRVGDAIQPSYPLLSSSPLAFNLSQHQGFFQWVSSLHQVAKSTGASASGSVLPVNIQEWFPLGLTGWISLESEGHMFIAPLFIIAKT